jgi:hypothetical protein
VWRESEENAGRQTSHLEQLPANSSIHGGKQPSMMTRFQSR